MIKESKKKQSTYGLWSTESYIHYPKNYDDVKNSLNFAKKNQLKVAIKGGAMSFSSVCLAAEGMLLLDMSQLNKVLKVSETSICVQGGLKITKLIKHLIVKNKMIFALSGSTQNTVAGNIGSDINGKDSWHFGNFGNNVISLKIMLSSGEIVIASKEINKELFLATISGLGLTGIILEAELLLQNIASSKVLVQEQKVDNLDSLINIFTNANKEKSHFLYAWLNPYANKANLGQGIVYSAHFVNGKNISTSEIVQFEKKLDKKYILGIPMPFFWKLMRIFYTSTVHKIASHTKFLLQKKQHLHEQSFYDFQYPMLRVLPNWNLYFYPHGFTEIQILFPLKSFKKDFIKINEICKKFNITPLMSAVRRHCKNDSYLSFSLDGMSFTINYSRNPKFNQRNKNFEKELIQYCAINNGKIYLSKFPYIEKEEFNRIYPMYKKFKTVKKKFDTSNLFQSHAL